MASNKHIPIGTDTHLLAARVAKRNARLHHIG